MDSDERRSGVNVAHDEDDEAFDAAAFARVLLTAWVRCREKALKAKNAEVSPTSGEVRFGDLLYALKAHASILQGKGSGRGNRELEWCDTLMG